MALSTKEKEIISKAKSSLKVMEQISRLDKEISTLNKKLEHKQNKISQLIDMLDKNDDEILDSSSILN